MTTLLLAIALSVTLNWQDNSANEEGFNIYRQLPGAPFVKLGTVAADVATFQDPASTPEACYRVTAFNLSGESLPSNTACTPTLPDAPSDLHLTITLTITTKEPTP